MTVQKIKPTIESEFELAKAYYRVLFSVNNIHLTEMEYNLVSFIATKGSLSVANNKDLFCQAFKTNSYSVNNTSHRLKKKGIMRLEDKRLVIAKEVRLDFKKPIILQITLDAKAGQ